MQGVYKKARAKINLYLEITNKRDDGYHDIESIFQKINLYDELYIEKLFGHSGIEIKSNNRSLENSKNIIYKAYYRLKMEFPQITRVKVILKKNIPMQAGLGGGSSDCATFIEGINKLFNLKLTKEKMKKIGKELGADIPSMFHEKPLIARGIGEIIEEINDTIKYYLIVIKPNFSCSTKEMYKKIDIKKLQFGSKIDTNKKKREEYFIVKEVLSPEQLLLNNGMIIKLLGIKEKSDTKSLAIEYLKGKFKKRKIYLKYDELKYDKDNSLLCYVYLDNKTFINNHLIRTGYVAVDIDLDYSFKDKFLKSLPA